MRVGIVCEGPTDFWAISSFVGESLKARGVSAIFVDLQPTIDASSASSGGGWTNAFAWLENNPRAYRRIQYLDGGLFGNGLSGKACDCLLVQIDSDVLDGDDFANYIRRHYGIDINVAVYPSDRFDEVQKALAVAAGYQTIADAILDQHVIAPAVENTDAWCVAARDPTVIDVESRRKNAVLIELERCFAEFEDGAPPAGGLKNEMRRKLYCAYHKENYRDVENLCALYAKTVTMLSTVLPPPQPAGATHNPGA